MAVPVLDLSAGRRTILTIPPVAHSLLPGSSFSLDGLLSRQPFLRGVYHHALEKNAQCFLGSMAYSYAGGDKFTLRLAKDSAVPDLLNVAQQAIPQLRGAQWSTEETTNSENPFGSGCERTEIHDALAMFPASSDMGVGHEPSDIVGYIVAPSFDQAVLSETLQLYILSYLLGMLVRYYPSIWMHLLSGGGPGDSAMPVLRSAIDLVRDRFPSLALAGLASYVQELSLGAF